MNTLKNKNKITQFIYNTSPSRIMVFGFSLIILIGAILLSLPISSINNQTSFIDALFTSTSAVCVTGLSVVDTGTHWSPFGQVVILCLIQVGGIGFMTIATLFALIYKKKINLKELILIQESLNQLNTTGIVKLAKNVLIITFLIEGIGVLLLSIIFVPKLGPITGVFYSLFHSVSAFCNAGFDLMGNIGGEFSSLTYFMSNPLLITTISALIILGGLGFSVIVDIIQNKKIERLSVHTKLVLITTIILVSLGTLLIFIMEINNNATLGNLSKGDAFLSSFFQSVTTRTAGFNTIDISLMNESTLLLMVVLMFVGASPASTGGGIKTTTFTTLICSVKSFIENKEDIEVFKRRIDLYVVRKAISIFFIGICIATFGTILLLIIEPNFSILEAMFEVVSAFTTTGLSIKGSYNLSCTGKLLIMLFMFIGRTGSLTVLIALSSNKSFKKAHIRYPDAKVLVG